MTRNPIQQLVNRNDERFFINAQDIKKWCPVSANIPDSEFFPAIALVHDIYIKPVLNTRYDAMWSEWELANYNPDDIRDNTQSPDGVNYKELYQQLYKAAVWYSFVKALTALQLKVEAKGIVSENADFSSNEGYVGLNRLIQEYTPIATQYQDQFVCYLRDTFPPTEKYPDEGNRFPAQFYFRHRTNTCKTCK